MTVESLTKPFTLARIAIAALIGAMAFGALTAQKADKIDNAVQRGEFSDSARAIRQALAEHVDDEAARHASTDSVIRASQRRLEEMVVRQEDRDCAEKGYPLPWCAEAARRIRSIGPAAQAGRGRP